jgi:predicted nucleotidyltransferase
VESLPEPFAAALAETLDALRADAQVEAVFLGGSLALGLASKRSDLDLVVIKSAEVQVRERYVRYVGQVQVQVIAGPPRQFDIWLEKDRPWGTVLRQMADGRLLFDRSGLGAHYRSLAQDVVAKGLEPMTPQQIHSRRFLLTELLDDVADWTDDPALARFLMATGLSFLVETAFLWHQRWTPKGKRALTEIQDLDPVLAQQCHDFLMATDLAPQWAAFEAMVARALAPLGGELREPWAAPPEQLPQAEKET